MSAGQTFVFIGLPFILFAAILIHLIFFSKSPNSLGASKRESYMKQFGFKRLDDYGEVKDWFELFKKHQHVDYISLIETYLSDEHSNLYIAYVSAGDTNEVAGLLRTQFFFPESVIIKFPVLEGFAGKIMHSALKIFGRWNLPSFELSDRSIRLFTLNREEILNFFNEDFLTELGRENNYIIHCLNDKIIVRIINITKSSDTFENDVVRVKAVSVKIFEKLSKKCN
jgi:hypothetical protein